MVTIDGYRLDVSVTEEHSREADVTMHPVEKGADIADHVRARPARLTVEGIVSNTPIGQLADLRLLEGDLPANDAYTRLYLIYQLREPVTVETDIATYENMVLQNFIIPRSKDTGDALTFRAQFVQVILVTNERTTIRVAVPRAKKKTNLGEQTSSPQATSPAGADDEAGSFWNKSWLRKIANEIKGGTPQ